MVKYWYWAVSVKASLSVFFLCSLKSSYVPLSPNLKCSMCRYASMFVSYPKSYLCFFLLACWLFSSELGIASNKLTSKLIVIVANMNFILNPYSIISSPVVDLKIAKEGDGNESQLLVHAFSLFLYIYI